MDKTFTWTIDCEHDFGGKTSKARGITEGLPRLIETFRDRNIKALLFISTELLNTHRKLFESIRGEGHEIGSHGHFHTKYKEEWRKEEDRKLSISTLQQSFLNENVRYRAPWFSHEVSGELYSNRKSHVSVLKTAWFQKMIPANPIFYIHPFDIVEGKNPPNLFCKILYSRPKKVWDCFSRLTIQYPGRMRLC